MAQPIYKVWMAKYTESWYTLSKEEQEKFEVKVADALKQVGGETVVFCLSLWGSENWMMWGVEKYPSIEAVQQHAMLLFNLNHFQYIESTSYLGAEPPEVQPGT